MQGFRFGCSGFRLLDLRGQAVMKCLQGVMAETLRLADKFHKAYSMKLQGLDVFPRPSALRHSRRGMFTRLH